MNKFILDLIDKYETKNKNDYENALHEIIQELASNRRSNILTQKSIRPS